MSTVQEVSRRSFLQGILSSGALVLCARFVPADVWAAGLLDGTSADRATLHTDVWAGINPDGTVFIISSRSEMGTGIRTSLPMVLADELDADWKRVKIEQALGNEKLYGDQDTDGSHSIRSFFDVMRQSGASARTMLTQAAAQRWGVPIGECAADLHTIVHRPSGRRLGYGELAADAAKLPIPKKEDLQFKPRSVWRYIGKGTSSYDLRDLCTGNAMYGMDARIDGMVYASVEHPPVLGGTVKSYDDQQALQVKGVQQTVAIDPFKPPWGFQPLGGVAVIANNTWAAFQGRKKLNISWEDGPNASYNSDTYRKELEKTSRQPGKVVRNEGDVDAAFASGAKVLEAGYYLPHLAHAAMEPLVATADFKDGKVTIWAPTQSPQGVVDTVSSLLGISKDDVTCHVTLLGGGFGRKSKPDYVGEAAVLSKKLGKPVKVVWTREDDIQFDYLHSVSAMYLKAAVDARGRPTAWLHRSVFPPIGSMNNPNATTGDEISMGASDVPYDIPNLRVENGEALAHIRIGWLRSVGNIYNAFAVQTFTDELAHAAGRDPVEYLLDVIGPPRIVNLKDPEPGYPFDTARLRRVTEMAAEKAGWGKRKFGHGTGIGIASHRSFLTYVSTVVEVEVNDKGEVRIPHVFTAVDAGTIVNPELVRLQFEGAAVFGTSIARSGEITVQNGRVVQTNFNNYAVSRMSEAPLEISVDLVDSNEPPAGVGEPGVPPFVPALGNAIFSATGKRLRELPLSKTNLARQTA
ncbi:MAG: molybdopterin cofactor-binding domain-containing protein [Terriglobia bacterium]|jgi:isoquinoline 1-oxidoreductase beta subunit